MQCLEQSGKQYSFVYNRFAASDFTQKFADIHRFGIIFIFFVCFVFAGPLMKLFTSDTEVIRHGVIYLKLISVMYILPAITNGIQGYFRGIGDLKITLLSSFINMGVRVLAAIPLVFALGMGIEALPFSYLAGWIGMLIAEIPLLVKNYRAYIKSIR